MTWHRPSHQKGKNMKKKKDAGKVGEALLEGLIEIILTFACFGVGALIFSILGIDLDSAGMSDDTIILIGIIAIVVIAIAVCSIVQLIKKKSRSKERSGEGEKQLFK